MRSYDALYKTILIAVAAVVISLSIFSLSTFSPLPARKALKGFLNQSLVKTAALSAPEALEAGRGNGAIYVLGGAQGSLEGRFKTAAALYREGAAKKILIYSREGITEYSSAARRNLTNNEHAVMTLAGLGVRPGDIELVQVKKILFGTYSEAKTISKLASGRRYDFLILVSSSYHTMRVWLIFSKFMDRDIRLYVYGSRSDAGLRVLLTEYIKLAVYRCLVLI